ncbi:MAG: DUF3048 domain-containing protein [Lachnospiraceae bacterium]|nr:DUF3048 domain-containing protein [Lachnospiraceae bacterium]
MKKRLLGTMMALAVVSALTVTSAVGCGKKEEETEATETETEITTEVETETETETETEVGEVAPEGMGRSYLTGEWVTEAYANQRPVGIMIENTSSCQPTYGTSNAKVIYEFQAEGGITRLLALFEDISGMEKIGNIRSCRPYFAYTAMAHEAIYIHCGGSIEAYEQILNIGLIDNIDEIYRGTFFFRSSDRSSPHNLYTSTDDIVRAVNYLQYDVNHSDSFDGYFNFNTDDNNELTLDGGQDCAVVEVYQANPKPWFVYNEEDGLYYRYEFGSAQMDALTGEQLAVKNVIIQEAPVDAYYDEQDHDRTDVDITAGGNGWYITNGKAIPITWTCAGNAEVTHYYDLSGNEITLNQGKTWIDVMDVDDSEKNVIYATYEDYQASK